MMGSTLFTSSGTKFFHMFNISLCGNTSVTCANNVSFSMEGEATTVSCLDFLQLNIYVMLNC